MTTGMDARHAKPAAGMSDPPVTGRPYIPVVVDQHVDDLADAWNVRQVLLLSARCDLTALARCDDRVAANLEGCALAGDAARRRCLDQLQAGTAAAVFAAASVAVAGGDRAMLGTCLEKAGAVAGGFAGLSGAMAWASRQHLAGLVRDMLGAADATSRALGLAACRAHGADPGPRLAGALADDSPRVRVEALRAAAELGYRHLVAACVAGVGDADQAASAWAVRSAVLLGDRSVALDAIGGRQSWHVDGGNGFRLAVQAMPMDRAHHLLTGLAGDPGSARLLIEGSGIVGDPGYVPWLIGQMGEPRHARAAGDAFSLVTGVDVDAPDLRAAPPDGFESGPTDDPDDPDLDMDPDEALPWPDAGRVAQWWAGNASRFHKGQRYFAGAPVTRAHCIDLLEHGYQRQRVLAAHYLCLLDPGTPLFNTSAPAWRQRRLLAQMR